MKNRNFFDYDTKNIFLHQIKFIRRSAMCLSVEIVYKTDMFTYKSTIIKSTLKRSLTHEFETSNGGFSVNVGWG